MTWTDFHQRQHAIKVALEHAHHHPDELPVTENVPAARAVFENDDELLCALQYKWTLVLTGRVGVALAEAGDHDHLDAVRTAWHRAAVANPVLRRVLDEHATEPCTELRRGFERERHMLALASGLVDHGEPVTEIVRAGSALLRLLRAPAPEHGDTPDRFPEPAPSR